jgi:hypothetical protein
MILASNCFEYLWSVRGNIDYADMSQVEYTCVSSGWFSCWLYSKDMSVGLLRTILCVSILRKSFYSWNSITTGTWTDQKEDTTNRNTN